MTFQEFKTYVDRFANTHADQRYGQWAFNALVQERPAIADAIRGSLADPFYRNERLEAFWIAVERSW